MKNTQLKICYDAREEPQLPFDEQKQMPSNTPANQTPPKIIDDDDSIDKTQRQIRQQMMDGSLALMPKLFSALENMKDEPFVKSMIQVLKFSLPAIKSIELKENMSKSLSESFLQHNGIDLTK
jgi:hypothetical protein